MTKNVEATEDDKQELRQAWGLILLTTPIALSVAFALGAGAVLAAVTAVWPYVFVRQHLLQAASGSLMAATFFATAAVLGYGLLPSDGKPSTKRPPWAVAAFVFCWLFGGYLVYSAYDAAASVSYDCAFKNERWCMVKMKDVEVEWSANPTQ